MKTAVERALDIAYDVAAVNGKVVVTKAMFVALAADGGEVGKDIRKIVNAIAKHIEADRAEAARVGHA